MSNNGTEIVIETAKRRKHRVPKVLNAPELPLDAPDYETFLKQLDQPQPSESNDNTDPLPPT
jgi:hypothetical protein